MHASRHASQRDSWLAALQTSLQPAGAAFGAPRPAGLARMPIGEPPAPPARPSGPADREGTMAGPTGPRISVVMHDVAPAQWSLCQKMLVLVRRMAQEADARLRVTLLVVPGWHGNPCLPDGYLQWLHRLQGAGHELALHGLTHLDEAPRGGPLSRFERDFFFSAGEGEFAALRLAEAARRLRVAQTWARVYGLEATGFVAPAWLMNEAAWIALRKSGFKYVCTAGRLVTLPDERSVAMRALGFSPRGACRRAISLGWARTVAHFSTQHPLLRLDLHPTDAKHAMLTTAWEDILRRELPRRQAVLLRDAVPAREAQPPRRVPATALRPAG